MENEKTEREKREGENRRWGGGEEKKRGLNKLRKGERD